MPIRSFKSCLKQDQFLYGNTKIDGYKLGELEQVIYDNDGYTAEIFTASLLIGLGINEKYHYEPLSVLSGGYKLRVLLA